MRLTDLSIRKLKPQPSGQKIYYDDALGGFGLRVSRKTKAFIVTYGENRKRVTLGKYPEMSLADARKKAKKFLSNPQYEGISIAYPAAREDFLEECNTKNRPKTVKEYTRYLKACHFNKKLEDISRRDLQKHLQQYDGHPSTYAHALTAFKVFFNWAIRHEYIDKHPLAGERAVYPTPRDRVLTSDEIKSLWLYEDQPFSNILKLLILLGQRRSETAAIHSDWIDVDTIVFPPEITKNKRRHVVPFGPLAAQYLIGEGQLFGNAKGTFFSGWSKAKARLDKHLPIPHWSLHDLRRTHSTMSASLGIPLHIEERILNHASGAATAGVAGIYNRYDYLAEARDAVVTYEQHISKLIRE
jgi:integrase